MNSAFEGKTLGLYIHIPFCLSKCSYCDFFSIASKERVPSSYVSALCNEIRERFHGGRCIVDSVYVGGGTPSLLSDEQLTLLFECIKENVPLSSDCEITIEVNPDDVNPALVKSLEENGVNRISCGIQSFNDASLSFCSRRADSKTNKKALDILKTYWKGQLSLDIICAMPCEEQSTFISGLKEIVSYKPDHISMYSLTIEEETPLGQQLSKGDFFYNYDCADDLWLSGKNFLESAGYMQYEVSNFCLPDKECKHNLKYWSYADYVGCGSGAAGTLYNNEGGAERLFNIPDITLYSDYWNAGAEKRKTLQDPFTLEVISNKDAEFEFFMMSLRKLSGFSVAQYKNIFHHDLPETFINLIEKWQAKNLAEIIGKNDDTIYTLGKKGIIFLNSFLKELL